MRASALVLLLSSGLALAGCATASSSSFTQAPLFLSLDDESVGDVGAEQPLAPYGTLDRGVANYSVLGGNAVLPVRAVTPLDAGVQANVLGTPVGLSAVTGLPGTLQPGVAANAGAVGVAANVTNGTVAATVALPGNTTAVTVAPNIAVGPSSLITAGPVLGNAIAAAQPVAGNAAALLNATATDLTRLCKLPVCR